jgi:hypothetical protein
VRNLTKLTAVAAALAAIVALGASNAHAEPSMDKSSTIQVDDGKGGWKPYEPKKIPAGPTGISVDDGKGGWKPYNPAKPGPGISVLDKDGKWVPYKPKSKHSTVIKHVTVDKRTTKWTYWLMQDGNGALYINITDADGNRVAINGEVPMPGGGPIYPVR